MHTDVIQARRHSSFLQKSFRLREIFQVHMLTEAAQTDHALSRLIDMLSRLTNIVQDCKHCPESNILSRLTDTVEAQSPD